MKAGIQQSKPVMTARPPMPAPRSQEELLRDLERVEEITESPARAAAQAVAQPLEGAGQSAVPQVPAVAAAVPAKPKAAKNPMPWEQVEDEGTVSFNFKLPRRLAAKLKYVGDTTYGETMTSIVAAALEAKLEKMLKERQQH